MAVCEVSQDIYLFIYIYLFIKVNKTKHKSKNLKIEYCSAPECRSMMLYTAYTIPH